jgi:hypothetical protein
MTIQKCMNRFLLSITLVILLMQGANAQERKVAQTPQALYNEIAHADSVLFGYFNAQKFESFKAMFSKDLEWFQDNGGLQDYNTVFKNFKNMFARPYKLSRQLVSGTLEVHPIKDYGAIEIGTHQFKHMENGKEEIGNFKFLMIWQKKNGQWKISRVVSYDH